MSRPMWVSRLIKAGSSQKRMPARLTRVPGIGRVIERWLFEGDDIIFLPRDEVIELGETVEEPEGVVLPSTIIEHFINEAAYHWIMDECICRAGSNCSDYPHDLGCLFLGQAAMGINPGLGRRVTREEALEHQDRCREAGLVQLVGRNRLDTVWLGVGPGTRLLTICNCCPCCCLWTVLPHLAGRIAGKVTRMPGVSVRVTDACVGCGTCARGVCFASAVSIVDGRAVISDACRGCGRCVTTCPEGAVRLTVEGGRFVEESIERITPLVDVT